MLTITGRRSYLKTCINLLKGFIGKPVPTTVLICFCERCGYGRADHPETAGKPWVVTVRPRCCKECGSPYWDGPNWKAEFVSKVASVISAKSAVDGRIINLASGPSPKAAAMLPDSPTPPQRGQRYESIPPDQISSPQTPKRTTYATLP
jgi:hypothetical protein